MTTTRLGEPRARRCYYKPSVPHVSVVVVEWDLLKTRQVFRAHAFQEERLGLLTVVQMIR